MDKFVDDPKDPAQSAIYQINGEPAVAINGVPDVSAVYSSSFKLSGTNDSDVDGDPFFGEWMEGRDVRKSFGDKYYSGKVSSFDQEMNWYRVVYEDDDFEDLYWHELEEVLVPLDISIPLKKLPLQMRKCCKSSEMVGDGAKKPGRDHPNIAGKVMKSTRNASSKSKGKFQGKQQRRKGK